MIKYKTIFIYLFVVLGLAQLSAYASNTWLLDEDQSWDLIATDSQKQFFTNIEEAQKLVNDAKTKAAKKEFKAIQENFPEFTGSDFTLFVKAELLLSRMKLSEAARSFEKMLTKYDDSILRIMAIKREYEIGMAFLDGHKKVVLGLFPIKAYSEGISILEDMIDHAGYDTVIATDASLAIAKHYEKRGKYDEAYLKWYEIYSLGKNDSVIKRDALLGMARAKYSIYNDNPESKKPFYDSSCLRAAKSYYEMLESAYSEFAKENNVDEILNDITEQLAYKELSIGLYYKKMGNIQSANLYFDMVISNWPDTKSAEIAQNMLNENTKS